VDEEERLAAAAALEVEGWHRVGDPRRPRARIKDMKLAIVGAGVSGLVAAHLLHREHDITVFEAGPWVGGHTNTVRVDTAHETHHVDTGFIVFNDRNYPSFERLLARLGVVSQPSDMSFSVSSEHGGFEYASTSPRGLFARPRHAVSPTFLRMIADVRRFQRDARELLLHGDESLSLGEYLERHRYSRAFIERLIVPQASAVWSADPRQMWSFPARFLVQFFHNHGMLGLRDRPRWRTVRGGSQRYVEALIAPFRDRIHVGTPVERVIRHDDRVEVTPRGHEPLRFDEVVIATHSDQALRLLGDATGLERRLLGAIRYQPNEVVLHTDARLLPRRRHVWASWNYHLLREPPGRTTVTYHMNRLQSLRADREFCVTLNRTALIDPEKILRTFTYDHPVFTPEVVAAQREHATLNGRTHFAGAYWGHGFHEDGVRSGLRVAERFGARL
jgi:uncharacterized protein